MPGKKKAIAEKKKGKRKIAAAQHDGPKTGAKKQKMCPPDMVSQVFITEDAPSASPQVPKTKQTPLAKTKGIEARSAPAPASSGTIGKTEEKPSSSSSKKARSEALMQAVKEIDEIDVHLRSIFVKREQQLLWVKGTLFFAAVAAVLWWMLSTASPQSALKTVLQTKPYELKDLQNEWNAGKREWIRRHVPHFNVALIGKEGAGKTTTLRFIALHSDQPPEVVDQLETADGGTSHTQQFVPVRFDSVLFVDTKGLPDLSTKRATDIKRFLSGQVPYLVPHTWTKDQDVGWFGTLLALPWRLLVGVTSGIAFVIYRSLWTLAVTFMMVVVFQNVARDEFQTLLDAWSGNHYPVIERMASVIDAVSIHRMWTPVGVHLCGWLLLVYWCWGYSEHSVTSGIAFVIYRSLWTLAGTFLMVVVFQNVARDEFQTLHDVWSRNHYPVIERMAGVIDAVSIYRMWIPVGVHLCGWLLLVFWCWGYSEHPQKQEPTARSPKIHALCFVQRYTDNAYQKKEAKEFLQFLRGEGFSPILVVTHLPDVARRSNVDAYKYTRDLASDIGAAHQVAFPLPDLSHVNEFLEVWLSPENLAPIVSALYVKAYEHFSREWERLPEHVKRAWAPSSIYAVFKVFIVVTGVGVAVGAGLFLVDVLWGLFQEWQRKKKREQLQKQIQQMESSEKHGGTPQHWEILPKNNHLVEVPNLKKEFEELLQDSVGRGPLCKGGCSEWKNIKKPPISSARVTKVERIQNPVLWSQYRSKAASMKLKEGPPPPRLKVTKPLLLSPLAAGGIECDIEVNEFWLWHGTTMQTAEMIIHDGFEPKLALKKGLYGAGTYFTNRSCKARQYCSEDDCVLLLCRVIMGNMCRTKTTHKWKAVAPYFNGFTRYDSIFAEEKVANEGSQRHNEFVIYKDTQAYPEYLVHFKHIK